MNDFRIRDLNTRRVIEGTPSPLLIQTGRGDAYRASPGFWRLRDDSYDPKGTTYTRVQIEHTDDYRVDVRIQPVGPESEEAYDDYFIVVAASEQEAFRLGEAKAHEDVENRYGEEYGSEVTLIRARKGVSY